MLVSARAMAITAVGLGAGDALEVCHNESAAHNRLCGLNVIEQVQNVCQTTIARDAWERGQELNVHGWIYGIADGLARDLGTTVSDYRETTNVYQAAVAKLNATPPA